VRILSADWASAGPMLPMPARKTAPKPAATSLLIRAAAARPHTNPLI